MNYQTFWAAPTDRVCVLLRRYATPEDGAPQCPGHSYHEAPRTVALEDAPYTEWLRRIPNVEFGGWCVEQLQHIPKDDPRWPKRCAYCPYEFTETDHWQTNADELYMGAPDGILRTLRDLPIGALYDATWMNDLRRYTGADGISLHCVTPGGVWCIDSIASNCTARDDEDHKCWCRHGDPRTEPVTVDKSCKTCAAGGGSIQAGAYHGFLRGGVLADT